MNRLKKPRSLHSIVITAMASVALVLITGLFSVLWQPSQGTLGQDAEPLAAAVLCIVLSTLLIGTCVHIARQWRATATCFIIGMSVVGGICFYLTVVVEALRQGSAYLWEMIVEPIPLLFAGAAMGLFMSLFLLGLLRSMVHWNRSASRDAPTKALQVCGLWLIVLSPLVLLLNGWSHGVHGGDFWWSLIWAGHIPLVGMGCVLSARARLRHRSRWLDDVADGAIDGWAVVPLDEFDDDVLESWSLPSFSSDDDSYDAVLLRAGRGHAAGAYRQAEYLEPFAFVDRGYD